MLWQITSDAACRGCGRSAMDPDSGVILARTAQGVAVVLGLMRCGRIWLCPVCAAKIRHGRAEEITRAVLTWLALGGRAYLVTFTARHAANHQLAALMDAIQGTRADATTGTKRTPGAYQRLITGAAWAGDARRAANRDGIRGRIGYVGMIRATEITVGQINGWHPHIHAIVLVGGRTEGARADRQVVKTFAPPQAALEEWQGHWRAVWTAHLAKVDRAFTPNDEHGVDFKPLESVQDAQDLAKYLAKTQDGKLPALELARADLKSARAAGNLAPFELLGRIGDLTGGAADVPAGPGLDWCLTRWAEYEQATKGRRAIEWTRYLRPLLGIQGEDGQDGDLDVLFGLDGASGELRAGVRVTTRAWHQVVGRALDLAITEATEAGLWDDVGALVVAAGARADAVQLLTPGEIGDAWAAVLASLAERRERAAARRNAERAGRRTSADRRADHTLEGT